MGPEMPRRRIASARANHAQPPRWSAGSVKGAACRGAYQRPVRRGARKTPELSRVRLLACRRRPEAAGLSATTSGTPRFDKDRSATSCSRPSRLQSLIISVNRLYESGWAGTIPIVRDATATGQWLARQGAGVRLPNDLVESLVGFFRELAPAQIDRLTTELAQIDPSNWICTQAECRDLVGRLTTRDLHGSRPTT